MSIVHKYQFSGGTATMPLHEISAILTSTFQIGGDGNGHDHENTNTNALKHLGIPAGLVLSNVKELYNTVREEHVATLPEDMFDRMLALVSPDGKKIRPVLTPRKKQSNIKTRRV